MHTPNKLNTHTILLAGGKGTRMLSKKAKVLQKLAGKSLLEHILSSAEEISNKISVIVGFDKPNVEKEISKVSNKAKAYTQKDQIGTANAVKTVIDIIDDDEKVLILYGDVPLIEANTLKNLCSLNDSISILTTNLDDPSGYGRVIKDKGNHVTEIVEEKDANTKQKNTQSVWAYYILSTILSTFVLQYMYLPRYLPNRSNQHLGFGWLISIITAVIIARFPST